MQPVLRDQVFVDLRADLLQVAQAHTRIIQALLLETLCAAMWRLNALGAAQNASSGGAARSAIFVECAAFVLLHCPLSTRAWHRRSYMHLLFLWASKYFCPVQTRQRTLRKNLASSRSVKQCAFAEAVHFPTTSKNAKCGGGTTCPDLGQGRVERYWTLGACSLIPVPLVRSTAQPLGRGLERASMRAAARARQFHILYKKQIKYIYCILLSRGEQQQASSKKTQ